MVYCSNRYVSIRFIPSTGFFSIYFDLDQELIDRKPIAIIGRHFLSSCTCIRRHGYQQDQKVQLVSTFPVILIWIPYASSARHYSNRSYLCKPRPDHAPVESGININLILWQLLVLQDTRILLPIFIFYVFFFFFYATVFEEPWRPITTKPLHYNDISLRKLSGRIYAINPTSPSPQTQTLE